MHRYIKVFALLSLYFVLMNCNNPAKNNSNKIFWQAHRGGGLHEMPDNTPAAFAYTWKLGGIPEADIRSTKDSVIICLHDPTLARTTNAADEIKDDKVSSMLYNDIKELDAGSFFNESFKDQRIPTLEQVFNIMKKHPDYLIYLDLKNVNLEKLGAMIDSYSLGAQILIASPKQEECKTLKKIAHGVRTMLWIGGSAEAITEKFQKASGNGFEGLDQVQLHLNDLQEYEDWRYQLEKTELQKAISVTQKAGIDLEVFPFHFEETNLFTLLDMGIRWYATDEPSKFISIVKKWQENN